MCAISRQSMIYPKFTSIRNLRWVKVQQKTKITKFNERYRNHFTENTLTNKLTVNYVIRTIEKKMLNLGIVCIFKNVYLVYKTDNNKTETLINFIRRISLHLKIFAFDSIQLHKDTDEQTSLSSLFCVARIEHIGYFLFWLFLYAIWYITFIL